MGKRSDQDEARRRAAERDILAPMTPEDRWRYRVATDPDAVAEMRTIPPVAVDALLDALDRRGAGGRFGYLVGQVRMSPEQRVRYDAIRAR